MLRITRRRGAVGLFVLALGASLAVGEGTAQAAEQRVVTVRATNMAATGWTLSTTGTGTGSFVPGPAKPPLGKGSFQLTTSGSPDSVTMFNAKSNGTPLPAITAMGYYTFRAPTSTNPAVQVPSYQVPVQTTLGFTTLVWEPVYNPTQGPVTPGVWQKWDPYNGGNGIWWSSRAIPGVCAQTCYVPWNVIVAANPTATIFGVGFKAGSGWAGAFTGNVDAFSLGVSGRTTTYNFEPAASQCGKDDAKVDDSTGAKGCNDRSGTDGHEGEHGQGHSSD